MRGMTIISEVLFLAIIIFLIFLVYAIASPMIYSMQLSSTFAQTKSLMLDLDRLVQQVASEGKGSRRSIYMTMGAGTMLLNESADTIRWSLETESMMISPRSMQQTGNLIAGSNLNSMAYEGEFGGRPAYVLENEILRVYLNRTGSAESPQAYNTSRILLGVYNKRLSEWMPMQMLEISIDQNQNSTLGTGYTELVNRGYALPRAELVARINTSYIFLDNYTLSFTLESGADFLIIGGS